jgi:hypothetical protein
LFLYFAKQFRKFKGNIDDLFIRKQRLQNVRTVCLRILL